MPDTRENQRVFPQSSAQKAGRGIPVTRIGGLISVACGAVLGHAVATPAKASEADNKPGGVGVLPLIVKSDILPADVLLVVR